MKYSRRQTNTGNQLADLHMRDFEKVAHLYDGQNPGHLDTYRQRAEALEMRFSSEHRHNLVAALVPYLKATNASNSALQQVERLRDRRAVAVVTGQQSGLFLGPMYSIYKALSAIGLASRLEEDLKRPVVPVFWIASEDHDFGEVDHAYLVDSENDIQRLRLSIEPHPHQMVYHQGLTAEAVNQVIAQANAVLPDASFKSECIASIREAFQPGMSLSTWFAVVLNQVLGDYGLVLVDPCLPQLRELVAPVWRTTLENVLPLRKNLDEVYQNVKSLGVEPAVIRDRSNTTMFYVEDGKRYVLQADDRGEMLTARQLDLTQPLGDWLKLAEENPSAFSSNVLLRPVVQDNLLPTLCYVGGGAEISYHPLSAGVFHTHQLTLPPLLLRQRMTLVPPAVQRSMNQFHVNHDIYEHPVNLVDKALANEGGDEIAFQISALKQDIESKWERFADRLAYLGPQIEEIAKNQAQKEQAGAERVRKKTELLLERQQQDKVRKLRGIERWLWTDGHLQERRLSLIAFWSRFGVDWIKELPRWADYQCQGVVYQVEL
ncbi:bacillithiol biosynthesis cysteine-adding enzyme BshC [Alicyclobacillus sp. SO9]|uniref:bacillithiol biosynthesis cysteine-adding enzyme BshC n=1 Tax=Alicyclobacillus sp. SO9 TaxID=2665646 RepID=UPI0018E784FC|nr:bacillithiol biosynthesis cysteine-adding enzyme BshC [Alicyclobacillus sp. SO9]QQE80697.1 bacillithiol biosynthesis cysteine-adding enzyme BshC [Alicyclobacillus sp. SO9]